MIVNWSGDNMKIIPIYSDGDTSTTPAEFCTLAPGYNEIDNAVWAKARTMVADDVANSKITEEWARGQRPEKEEAYPLIFLEPEDAREKQIIRVPATLRDIPRPGVLDRVVKNTYHLPTLQNWSVEESRPDVQAALIKQIKAVEAGEIVG